MRVASKELIAQVMALTDDELRPHAFRRRKTGVFTRPLSDEALGWLGLNTAVARGDGALHVNPVVGVRYQPIEDLVAELTEDTVRGYSPPTICTPLGYLLPEGGYRTWTFVEGAGVRQQVQGLVAVIIDYGLPFMEENSTLRPLCATLERGQSGYSGQAAYRLPVAYYLLGELDRAEEAVETHLSTLGARTDPAAEAYQRFGSCFKKHLSRAPP
jgi:hypothetical protein